MNGCGGTLRGHGQDCRPCAGGTSPQVLASSAAVQRPWSAAQQPGTRSTYRRVVVLFRNTFSAQSSGALMSERIASFSFSSVAAGRWPLRLSVLSKSLALGACASMLLVGCAREARGGGTGARSVAGASVPMSTSAHANSAGDQSVVATIGGNPITVGDLQARLDKQSPFVRQRYADDDKKKEFLDNQVRFELLAQEAMKRGLQNDPDVQETIKKVMVQKLTRLDFEGKVKLSDVSDAEMQTYYDSHNDEYNKPEMVRTSVIIVEHGADKAKARAVADRAHKSATLPKTIGDRAHFRRLVTEFSTDAESKKTGGDLRYLSQKDLSTRFGPEAASAAWALAAVNAVSPVLEFKTADGKLSFVVFKKTGTRKPISRAFDQVKNQIRNLLYREKRSEAFNSFVEKLKTDFKVQTHPEELKKLVVKAGPEGSGDGTMLPPGGGPGGPGGPRGMMGPGGGHAGH